MSLCINPYCSESNNHRDMLFCQACGSELLLQGRYRVKSKLGGGGFGQTYEVTDNTAKAKVLKVLIDDRPKAVELFQREVEVLKVLNHPGIPKVEKDGYFLYFPRNSQKHLHCLVMEKIEGLNLSKYIQQQGNRPINPELAIKWLRELTIILQQVHSQKFFHRDIKPSNIMLQTDGSLALIDFGTVRQVTKTYVVKKAAGDITGIVSSGYTPLEQINGQAVRQSDFFALGRTFIYLLTGKDPNKLYNPYTNILEWRDMVLGISPKFADLLDKMMETSVVKRPENTQVILQKLGEIDGILPPAINNQAVQTIIANEVSQVAVKVQHAELWKRFLGYVIDSIILFCIGIFIGFSLGFLTGVSSNSGVWDEIVRSGWMGASFGWFLGILELLNGDLLNLTITGDLSLLIGMILNWFYFTLFESSIYKATPGKLIFGINVTDLNQEKISFSQVNIRYWAKLISFASLTIGFFLPAFTAKKQGLHDIIAHTIVIQKM